MLTGLCRVSRPYVARFLSGGGSCRETLIAVAVSNQDAITAGRRDELAPFRTETAACSRGDIAPLDDHPRGHLRATQSFCPLLSSQTPSGNCKTVCACVVGGLTETGTPNAQHSCRTAQTPETIIVAFAREFRDQAWTIWKNQTPWL